MQQPPPLGRDHRPALLPVLSDPVEGAGRFPDLAASALFPSWLPVLHLLTLRVLRPSAPALLRSRPVLTILIL